MSRAILHCQQYIFTITNSSELVGVKCCDIHEEWFLTVWLTQWGIMQSKLIKHLKTNEFSWTDHLGSTCVFKAMEISSGSHGEPREGDVFWHPWAGSGQGSQDCCKSSCVSHPERNQGSSVFSKLVALFFKYEILYYERHSDYLSIFYWVELCFSLFCLSVTW